MKKCNGSCGLEKELGEFQSRKDSKDGHRNQYKVCVSHFQPGIDWDNYGKGSGKWNIDHIIQLSSFNLTDREQFLKTFYYKNLQPLWAEDHSSKDNRLDWKK